MAVIALLGGLVAWTRITNPPLDVSNVENNSVVAASSQNGNIAEHTKGSKKNKILLVEFGDYQCPSCAGAHANIEAIMDEYKDDLTFVFRNFPLTAIHPNARAAAAVAETAGLQGKFWEMYDTLYEKQNDWSSLDASQRTTVFNSYATNLSLDIEKFKTDLASKEVAAKINFDMALGKKASVSATPSFFLNGKKVDEATSSGIVQGDLTEFKKQINALIAEKK